MVRSRLLLVLMLVAGLGIASPAAAQSSSPQNAGTTSVSVGQSVVILNGPWKFHIGDDPRWADPDFDDSQWETVDLTPRPGSFDPISGAPNYVPGWTAKGHPGYWGYAWYRMRVKVDAHSGTALALAGPSDVDDVYQVFSNGALVGSFGKFQGGNRPPVPFYTQPVMFRLPPMQAAGQAPATVVLSFRVYMEASTLLGSPDAGGFHVGPTLGEAGAVTASYELAWLTSIRNYTSVLVEATLFFLLTIVLFSMVLVDRSDPVYRWLTGVFLVTTLERAAVCGGSWTQTLSINEWSILQDAFLRPLMLGGWVMVWWVWFRLRRPAWIPTVIGLLTLLYMLCNVGEILLVAHSLGAAFHIASLTARLLFLLFLIYIVVEGVHEQGREGWLALPAVLLMGIAQFQTELAILHIRTGWFPLGQQITLGQIAYLTLAAVIFVLMIRRLLLSLRQQRQMALDVKQAQEVQKVLIPEEQPQVPGLAIESEYRPAREVGGDFFQIVPHPTDGGVLIVAGDVTGKGLQAGMLVALIVGAIRTAVEKSFDPLQVLQALNRRLYGRGHAYATCLTLGIDAEGRATLANAGHMPPYLNGKELHVEGALPLGMLPSAEFSVMHFQLEPGDRLMLLSDGVAEAQNEQGRLFGFERIHEMLAKPVSAVEVAAAAQSFGQQDDISVLSITREAAFTPALT